MARVIVGLDNDPVFRDRRVVARAVDAFARRPDLGAIGFNIQTPTASRAGPVELGYPAHLRKKFRERF